MKYYNSFCYSILLPFDYSLVGFFDFQPGVEHVLKVLDAHCLLNIEGVCSAFGEDDVALVCHAVRPYIAKSLAEPFAAFVGQQALKRVGLVRAVGGCNGYEKEHIAVRVLTRYAVAEQNVVGICGIRHRHLECQHTVAVPLLARHINHTVVHCRAAAR